MTAQRFIDLRSDTVTVPSAGMRRAMAEAPVGDDVYAEDPTVNRLQEMAAERTGKEAALYVPSGTMVNLVAIMTHAGRGDEVIVGSEAHVLHYEMQGAAGVAGVQLRTVRDDPRGRLDLDELETTIRPAGAYNPRTALVWLENTHNRCSGAVIPPEHVQAVAGIAHGRGVPLHIDGARVFNAAVALGTSVGVLAAPADTIGFCFSKGLGAPVGSVLCGPADFIRRARKMRRQVGGGMRQAGIIAAGAIYALEHMVDRLAEDHANAKLLARGLAELPMIDLDPETIDTNIVIFGVRGDATAFARSLRVAGVLTTPASPGRLRMVTHYGIDRADIEEALARVRHAAAALA